MTEIVTAVTGTVMVVVVNVDAAVVETKHVVGLEAGAGSTRRRRGRRGQIVGAEVEGRILSLLRRRTG